MGRGKDTRPRKLNAGREPKRAEHFDTWAALFEATRIRCVTELGQAGHDRQFTDLLVQFDEMTLSIRSDLKPAFDLSRKVASLLKGVEGVEGVDKAPHYTTPLAALVHQCGEIDAYTVAIRALAAGHRPDMTGRDLSTLTTSDVIATVRKAVDRIRKPNTPV